MKETGCSLLPAIYLGGGQKVKTFHRTQTKKGFRPAFSHSVVVICQSSLRQVYQSQTQELTGEFVDVLFVLGAAAAQSHNQHGDDASLDPVDDPVFLTHRPQGR